MAKATKRVATRKKSSKRGKASAKLGRKTAAKRATPERGKVQGPAGGRGCSETRGQKKATTEDPGFRSTPGRTPDLVTLLFSASRALPPSCARAWRLPCRV